MSSIIMEYKDGSITTISIVKPFSEEVRQKIIEEELLAMEAKLDVPRQEFVKNIL